jgi:hypothetical protein
MKVRIAAVGRWLMVFSIFWPLGCSLIQSITPEDVPQPAPLPRVVEQPLESQPEQVTPPPVPEVKYFTHTIKWSGENLIRISRWYTGTGQNWLPIVEANPSIDPRRIKIGDSILIPESLLKTREPMPISYLAPTATGKEAPSVPPAESLPNTEEVELFGPIDTEAQTDRLEGTGSPLPLETIE